MGPNKLFILLDLKNGFNQLPLHENSRYLTTFVLFNQTYQYTRIPFGLKLGPKLFQRVIQEILADIKGVFVYIDDILIYANNKEEHDEILKEVIKRLGDRNIQINLEKSNFNLEEISLLGYKVSEKGI